MLFIGIKNEFKKIIMFRFFLLLSILISVIPKSMSMFLTFASRYFGIRYSSLVFSSHNIMISYIVPFFAIVLATRLFTREEKKGYTVGYILKPISRTKIFFSKIISICIYIMIMVLINFLSSSIITMVLEGISGEDVYLSIQVLLVSIMPVLVIVFLSGLVSQITKSRILNFIIFYSVFLVVSIIGSHYPSKYMLLLSSVLSFFKIFMGSNPGINSIVMNFFIIIGYILLFAGASGYIFETKDYN